jgi:hypothetical protein
MTASFDSQASVNLGSLEIALATSLIIFGVVVTQGYTDFQTCKHDRMFLKVLVCSTCFIYSPITD